MTDPAEVLIEAERVAASGRALDAIDLLRDHARRQPVGPMNYGWADCSPHARALHDHCHDS